MPYPACLSDALPASQRCADTAILAAYLPTALVYRMHVQALSAARLAWHLARRRGNFEGILSAELAWERAATALSACSPPPDDVASVLAAGRRRVDKDVAEVVGDD